MTFAYDVADILFLTFVFAALFAVAVSLVLSAVEKLFGGSDENVR